MNNVSKRSRKFHDPWGSKSGNRYGSVLRHQYMVARTTHGMDSFNMNIDLRMYKFEWTRYRDDDIASCVIGPYSVERVR